MVPTDSVINLLHEIDGRLARGDKRPVVIGILGDVRGDGDRHQLAFLNRIRNIYMGGERIGRRYGAQYLYAGARIIGRGRVTFSLKRIEAGAAPGDISREYYRMLEEDIRRNPSGWILWNE